MTKLNPDLAYLFQQWLILSELICAAGDSFESQHAGTPSVFVQTFFVSTESVMTYLHKRK